MPGAGYAARFPGNLLHGSGLATIYAGMMSTQGRVAMDAEAYDRAWRIEQRAEELFKRDYPSGSFARRLPHFRSSYPDPVGDHYRRLAANELSNQ
jgi:hypothetical protein